METLLTVVIPAYNAENISNIHWIHSVPDAKHSAVRLNIQKERKVRQNPISNTRNVGSHAWKSLW